MNDSNDGFLHYVCDFKPQITMLLAVCVFFLLVSLASLVVLSPGTAAYAITLLNVAGSVAFATLFAGVLVLCRRQNRNAR